MFSSTTIALSTTMPTAKAIPASEITLIVRPNRNIARKVVITEMGIDTAITMTDDGERRKKKSTMMAPA